METKVLVIALVENEAGNILMRKKPAGSPPYEETWYIFGTELIAGQPLAETLQAHIARQCGIEIKLTKQLGWDTEVKADIDSVTKQFVYLDVECAYVSGELQVSEGIERLEWVPKNVLDTYDIVPPSKILFQKLGYLS